MHENLTVNNLEILSREIPWKFIPLYRSSIKAVEFDIMVNKVLAKSEASDYLAKRMFKILKSRGIDVSADVNFAIQQAVDRSRIETWNKFDLNPNSEDGR